MNFSEPGTTSGWNGRDARLEAFKLRWSLPSQVLLNDRQPAKERAHTSQSLWTSTRCQREAPYLSNLSKPSSSLDNLQTDWSKCRVSAILLAVRFGVIERSSLRIPELGRASGHRRETRSPGWSCELRLQTVARAVTVPAKLPPARQEKISGRGTAKRTPTTFFETECVLFGPTRPENQHPQLVDRRAIGAAGPSAPERKDPPEGDPTAGRRPP